MKFDSTILVFIGTALLGFIAYIIRRYLDGPKLTVKFNGGLFQSSPGRVVQPIPYPNESNIYDPRLSIREFNCQWRGKLKISNVGSKTATGVRLYFYNDSPQFKINNFLKNIDMIPASQIVEFETLYRLKHHTAPQNRHDFERSNNIDVVFKDCKFLIEYNVLWFLKRYTIYEFRDNNSFKLIKPPKFNSIGNYKPKNGYKVR